MGGRTREASGLTSTCVKKLEISARKLGLASARCAEHKTPNSYKRFTDHGRDRRPFFAMRGARTRFPDDPGLFPVLANKFPVLRQQGIRANQRPLRGNFGKCGALGQVLGHLPCNFPVKQGISVVGPENRESQVRARLSPQPLNVAFRFNRLARTISKSGCH